MIKTGSSPRGEATTWRNPDNPSDRRANEPIIVQ